MPEWSQADMAKIVAAVVAVLKPKAKARAKVARDTRTMAERRDAAVGGVCEAHGKRFATAAGCAYHFEHTEHAE